MQGLVSILQRLRGGEARPQPALPTAAFLLLPPQPSPCCLLSVHPSSKTNRGPQGVHFKQYFLWSNCRWGHGFKESEKGCVGGLITTSMNRDTQGRRKENYSTGLPYCPYTRDRPPLSGLPVVKYTYLHKAYVRFFGPRVGPRDLPPIYCRQPGHVVLFHFLWVTLFPKHFSALPEQVSRGA